MPSSSSKHNKKSGSKQTAAATTGGKKKERRSNLKPSAAAAAACSGSLSRELALVGLRVKSTTADGSCFFRAVSDQLRGDETDHLDLRQRVCELMEQQAESFEPFVEDEATLEQHLTRMRRPGVWAGHLELQATSLLLQANIGVYQQGQPRWCISNFPPGSRMLHLAYDGEHYDSIRRADDFSRGAPPAAIPDALTPAPDAASVRAAWSAADEQQVALGSGCDNPVLIRAQLQAAGGDVDAATEAVISIKAGEEAQREEQQQGEAEQQEPQQEPQQEQQQEEAAAAAADAEAAAGPCSPGPLAAGAEEAPPAEGPEASPPAASPAAAASAEAGVPGVTRGGSRRVTAKQQGVRISKRADKAPSRNKPCPCGSGIKAKACCLLKGSDVASKQPAADADGLPLHQLATLHI